MVLEPWGWWREQDVAEGDARVAVVTGASGGIGRAIALELAGHGVDVAVVYATNADGAMESVASIEAMGRRAIACGGDVGDAATVERLFEEVDAAFGRIDVLVNNAGQAGDGRPLHEGEIAVWERVLRTNLYGPYFCSREAARRMIARGAGGRIVNIVSVHEEAPTPGEGAYCVSKGGLRNLTRAMAVELAGYGITVNDVAPGMILTAMNQSAVDDAGVRAAAEAQIPLRRAGTPEDVARMVGFLCSDEGAYCTGSTYFVDGGWMLSWPPV